MCSYIMKIISIDVGMKHLAYCLFSTDDTTNYTIDKWGIIDLCNSEHQQQCFGMMKKNNAKCKRKSRFYKNNIYYCKIHAKNKKYLIPSKEMKYSKLKYKKVQELKAICNERNYSIPKKSKKTDYLEAILRDLSNNYFNIVPSIDSRKIDLITYGRQIKKAFSHLFNNQQIDCVLIESQVGPLALRMKVLQGMIMQHFIEHDYPLIKEISPANKLKTFPQHKKVSYRERKKLSIQITTQVLEQTPAIIHWLPYFKTHKKKDDLADAFLQGKWYIEEK